MPQDSRSEVLLQFPPGAQRRDTAFRPDLGEQDFPLVRDIAAGSGAAPASLYDRYAGLAPAPRARAPRAGLTLGLRRRILGNANEAEEVLQEVFLQVWRDAHRYDPERATPRGWLLLIARPRALARPRPAASPP